MVDAAGTTKYAYTIAGRLFTEDGPWASDTVTNYYNNGLRTNLSLAQPTGSWTNGFGYDAAKRLTSVTSPAGAFGYTFLNQASRLTQKITLPNTSYITNAYDNVARLLFTKLLTSSSSLLDAALYAYNAGNQRTTFTNAAGTWFTNTYDAIGQLKIANSSVNTEDRGYKYDAAWNLNYRTNNGAVTWFQVNSRNELTSGPDWGCVYDANGNLINPGANYNYPNFAMEYDNENRLAVVYTTNYLRYNYFYDGLGRLRAANLSSWIQTPYYGYWSQTSSKRYTYDGMRVIQERDASNVPTVSYTRGTDLSGTLEGAGGIGGLLARSHGYSAGNWSTHNFYHADGNGNITYLETSAQGLGASYRYDAFGNTTASSGSLASANSYRFSSKEAVSHWRASGGALELYYFGYRWYAPNLQRWVNRDPIGESGGINMYGFVRNEPAYAIDPFGLQMAGPYYPPIEQTWLFCASQIKDSVWKNHCESGRPAGDSSCHEAHCIANCRIARECAGGRATAGAGSWAKEIKDGGIKLIKNKGDGFSDSDMQANRRGRQVARECPEKSCEEACAGTRF